MVFAPARLPTHRNEARSSPRFPIALSFAYKRLGPRGEFAERRGTTIDLSGTGVFFDAQDRFEVGDRLRLVLDWPARIENRFDMVLVIVGRIVRTSGTQAGARIQRYELRARSASDERDVLGTRVVKRAFF